MSTSEKIKTFNQDLKERVSLEDEIFKAISQKIKEKLNEQKREKDVILDRFLSATKGKSIILQNTKM